MFLSLITFWHIIAPSSLWVMFFSFNGAVSSSLLVLVSCILSYVVYLHQVCCFHSILFINCIVYSGVEHLHLLFFELVRISQNSWTYSFQLSQALFILLSGSPGLWSVKQTIFNDSVIYIFNVLFCVYKYLPCLYYYCPYIFVRWSYLILSEVSSQNFLT